MDGICKLSGKPAMFPCAARACPLFGDCLVEYEKAEMAIHHATQLFPEELDAIRSLERGDPAISPAVTLFGKPLEHWKELHIAELQGRLRVFPLSYWEGYTCSQFMGYDDVGEPKWRDGHFYVCHNHKCRYRTIIQSNYCPNCGAAMKKEETPNA